jgi:hypothetical protein
MQDNKAINSSRGTPPVDLRNVTENRSTAGCNGVVESQVATSCFNAPPWYNGKEFSAAQPAFLSARGAGYKGNWNHVEAYFAVNGVQNGVGVANGVVQYWFNGTLVINRHDVLFRTGARANVTMSQFMIAPYMGDGSPVAQSMFVDDLVVATARPSARAARQLSPEYPAGDG